MDPERDVAAVLYADAKVAAERERCAGIARQVVKRGTESVVTDAIVELIIERIECGKPLEAFEH